MLPVEVFRGREQIVDSPTRGLVPIGRNFGLRRLRNIVEPAINQGDFTYAVSQLRRDGVLQVEGDQASFPKIDKVQGRDIVALRAQLEEALAWNLLMTPEAGIVRLRRNVEKMREAVRAGSTADFGRWDARFHSQLARGIGFCNNRELLQGSSDKLRILWASEPLDKGIQEAVTDNHRALVEAIAVQEPNKIFQLIEEQPRVYSLD